MNLTALFRFAVWKVKGTRIYALVGKSGTGKSFRAQLIAEKYRLSHIIDDGLLIAGPKILAGRSAKNDPDYMSAIQTAVFDKWEHREEVKKRLREEKIQGILILGTSEKMIRRICERLELPLPERILHIEEMSTTEELQLARLDREQGRHVIPVPALEVQKNFAQLVIDGIKVLLSRRLDWLLRRKRWEKTVVRPPFHRNGRITLSKSALISLVLHCVDEFNAQLGFISCKIRQNNEKLTINLCISAAYGLELKLEVPRLQAYIKQHIEQYTGLSIGEVNIKVTKLV